MADLDEQTQLDRLVRDISVEAIIDKLFRFIEMIVIATLLGVVTRAVWVEGSEWVAGGLALAAGLYVAIPSARWARSRLHPPQRLPVSLLILVLFGYAAISMTSPLRILLSETFKIDEPAARIEYRLWGARAALRACRDVNIHGPPPAPPPANDRLACERRWKSEIGRIEAEKQALIR